MLHTHSLNIPLIRSKTAFLRMTMASLHPNRCALYTHKTCTNVHTIHCSCSKYTIPVKHETWLTLHAASELQVYNVPNCILPSCVLLRNRGKNHPSAHDALSSTLNSSIQSYGSILMKTFFSLRLLLRRNSITIFTEDRNDIQSSVHTHSRSK